jgi:DNA adenine methylase
MKINIGIPRLTPPLKWPGGKHYLARKIVALMPPHTHYVEPYFGGGAVLLAKDPDGISEAVNDKHSILMNFWGCMASKKFFDDFQRRAEASPFSQELWEDSLRVASIAQNDTHWTASGGPRTDVALAFFIVCRQSLAGRMSTFAPSSRNRTRRGMNEQVSAWLAAVDGLPEVHARLRRVLMFCDDALKVIDSEDGPATLFYCDPPYLSETKTADAYQHEMTEEEHGELLDRLGGIEGKFLLSGYPSDLYECAEKKYGWSHLDFDLPNNAAAGKTKRRMTERLWYNFAPT